MISNSISNWFENVLMWIFTFPNRLWVLYNWMNSKSLRSFEPRGIKCHTVQFCPAKRNFWSYYYMVASTPASVYRLCSPFLPKIDKFSNITHQYIPVLLILLNFPKIQLSTLFSSLFQFWNSIRSVMNCQTGNISVWKFEKNSQFLGNIFGGRCVYFVNVANGNGWKWNIPNWIIIRFDCGNCWSGLKSIPN